MLAGQQKLISLSRLGWLALVKDTDTQNLKGELLALEYFFRDIPGGKTFNLRNTS